MGTFLGGCDKDQYDSPIRKPLHQLCTNKIKTQLDKLKTIRIGTVFHQVQTNRVIIVVRIHKRNGQLQRQQDESKNPRNHSAIKAARGTQTECSHAISRINPISKFILRDNDIAVVCARYFSLLIYGFTLCKTWKGANSRTIVRFDKCRYILIISQTWQEERTSAQLHYTWFHKRLSSLRRKDNELIRCIKNCICIQDLFCLYNGQFFGHLML